jgi:hypothetical protein
MTWIPMWKLPSVPRGQLTAATRRPVRTSPPRRTHQQVQSRRDAKNASGTPASAPTRPMPANAPVTGRACCTPTRSPRCRGPAHGHPGAVRVRAPTTGCSGASNPASAARRSAKSATGTRPTSVSAARCAIAAAVSRPPPMAQPSPLLDTPPVEHAVSRSKRCERRRVAAPTSAACHRWPAGCAYGQAIAAGRTRTTRPGGTNRAGHDASNSGAINHCDRHREEPGRRWH